MAALDFSQRADTPELMDTDCDGFEDYEACIADLARVNRASLTHRPTLAFLERLRRTGRLPRDRPLVVVDVASGYGDALRQVGAWAAAKGVAVDLAGVDLNPWAARAAAAATPPGRSIRWVTGDVFAYAPDGPIDIVMSTQFTHHLGEGDLEGFLRWMEATATLGWFIGDLHRHWLPYHFFRAWSRAARWHRFVQTDGPISISRAFTRADWRHVLEAAGLGAIPVEIRWHMPFRWSVARVKP